jgi:hypothetical protein
VATAALFLLFGGPAGAQTGISCSSFATQQQAQAFYNQHKTDDPSNPDPYHLDADGDGTACEGLPSAPAAVPTAAPVSTTPTPSIPKNGADTGVMALSGLSLLEAGYGMTLLARRYGVKRRNVPIYLLKKLVSAGKLGEATVALGDDVYLVHESAFVAMTDDVDRYVEVPTEEYFELGDYEDEPEEDLSLFTPPVRTEPSRPSVYAALAKLADDAAPVAHDVEDDEDVADDFGWRL